MISQFCFAQVNTTEAKAAYLLAEESYGKGDYKAALEYLQQVKGSLGTANCKILYLQVMVLKELNAKNPNAPDSILPIITQFEQSPDYKDFNEDKILEIIKIKLALKLDQKAQNEKKLQEKLKENAARDADAAVDMGLSQVFARYPPLNITIDALDKLKPELNVKEWKNTKKFPGIYSPPFIDYDWDREFYPFGRIEKDAGFKNQLTSVQISESSSSGKILGYGSILVYADKNINPDSAVAALVQARAIVASYEKKLGKKAAIASEYDIKGAHCTVYRWAGKKRWIDLCLLYYPNGKQPNVKLFEEISTDLQ